MTYSLEMHGIGRDGGCAAILARDVSGLMGKDNACQ